MKKNIVLFVLLLAVLSLGLTLVPHVSSQSEKQIKVLSYSWYLDSFNNLIVVGEVQNMGASTLYSVYLTGTVYTSDGQAQATSYTQPYVYYIIPQQKAPFYMEFNQQTSYSGDLNWLSLGVNHVDFLSGFENVTTSYQYQDLTLKDTSSKVDVNGTYWVSGSIQNTGTQTAQNIRVMGTFYNSSGVVVAIGYTGAVPLATSLAPSATLSFKVGAWDLNQNEVPSRMKISRYLPLIQTEAPLLSGTPPPPAVQTPIDSTPSSSDSNPNNPTDSAPWSTYAILAVVVILVSVGAVLMLKRRKSKAVARRKSPIQKKQK